MRNLLITIDYPPNRGGVARYLEALVKTFPDKFKVWSSVKTEDESVRHVGLIRQWVNPSWFPAVIEVITRARSYDRIWTSHIHPLGFVVYIAKFFTKKPYVVILHGLDFRLALRNPWKRLWTKKILNGADKVICNTRALTQDVRSFCEEIEPVIVYPTLPDFLSLTVGKSVRSRTSFQGLKLLTVSRLVKRKNHRAVIEAVAQIVGVEYDIVGDGPERESLEGLIVELGLESRVRIHAKVSDKDLMKEYEKADVFVLAPILDKIDIEGFGIVYLEAAQAGLPIIATKTLGVSEALSPTGSIQLIDPSVEAITRAIQELNGNTNHGRTMGETNKKFVKSFNREEQFSKLRSYV